VLLSGGYVMEPLPGIYENVLLFDFKSLYPTIMVTFLIDPLGFFCKDAANLVGPTGTAFSRIHSLLPAIITELLDARTRARRIKNQSLSYAIKILMNSFYGVLGSTACRFFSPDIAQAITGTGQYIFKTTSAYIEKKFSYPVIYGDTDSLFLHIGPGQQKQAKTLGQTIIADVNTWLKTFLKEHFNADSILELQFEDHFRHFLMPSIRGGTQGSKKRYCGTREQDGKLILTFKGMESVRSDWTALAKNFQNTLYEKVFKNEPVDELILETVQKIRLGKSDADLVYSKQLRKPVSEYTVHIPPHAQAAKLLENPGHVIRYVITTHGPQPIEKQTAPLDYDHYVLTQIKPIADSILELVGKKFDDIVSGQQDLFGAVR
jgi:DNA polymerase-2